MSAASAAPPAILFEGVQKTFWEADRPITALEHLSFAIAPGEYTCILGRSGCGKSTTANLLLGLERPTAGRIAVFGRDPVTEFAHLRGRLGSIFQSDRLLPWRTSLENIRLPLEILHLEESQFSASPQGWLERLGLEGFESAYPHQLSGGMRSRVALARALVAEPDILIADEAFAHLDEVSAERLRHEFHQLAKAESKTVLHITHSIDEALSLADRILVLGKPGHVIADIQHIPARDRSELRIQLLAQLAAPPRISPKPDAARDMLPNPALTEAQEWAT
jgi:NitT/TauT family transport system ATP-binding protein